MYCLNSGGQSVKIHTQSTYHINYQGLLTFKNQNDEQYSMEFHISVYLPYFDMFVADPSSEIIIFKRNAVLGRYEVE